MAGCYPYGVRAMWSERSRHMRGGAVLGSSGKVTGLAVRFLARDMRLTGAKAAGVPAALAPVSLMSRARIHTAAPPNRSSTLGHPRVPVADRPDAFEGRCSTGPTGAHVRNADHPAQSASRHRHHTQTLGMLIGALPTSLDPDGQLY